MKLIPYKQALKMAKQAIDDALIPVRAKQAEKSAELEIMKLEESILKLEIQIQEKTVQHPLNFNTLLDLMDERDLLVRKKTQLEKIVNELFPTEEG